MLSAEYIYKIIDIAFEEDMNYGDITTETLISEEQVSEARLIAKENGLICGIEVFKQVFKKLDANMQFDFKIVEGEYVESGTLLGIIKGKTSSILKAERTALNLLQRMSGISTLTYKMSQEIKEYKAKVVDTRKTTVGLRQLEKYAVKVGGGSNHRFNLSDSILIKDNHIQAVGSIIKAINIAKKNIPHTMKIEVEVETLEQLEEALRAKADIIMLDNMDIDTMTKAVKITNGKAILEASGNVSLESIKKIAITGVDIISCGALTHSVKAIDISLKF